MRRAGGPSWINWFCAEKGNEYFCEVDEAYIKDRFNLYNLSTEVPLYTQALEAILDYAPEPEEYNDPAITAILEAAEKLYGLIHARFIFTDRGAAKMLAKYKVGDFGRCIRLQCHYHPLLPCDAQDEDDDHPSTTVKLYCPKCEIVVQPISARHSSIEATCFGPGFPEIFFMTFPLLRPQSSNKKYIPLLYGFVVSPEAREFQGEAARTTMILKQVAAGNTNRNTHPNPNANVDPHPNVNPNADPNLNADADPNVNPDVDPNPNVNLNADPNSSADPNPNVNPDVDPNPNVNLNAVPNSSADPNPELDVDPNPNQN